MKLMPHRMKHTAQMEIQNSRLMTIDSSVANPQKMALPRLHVQKTL